MSFALRGGIAENGIQFRVRLGDGDEDLIPLADAFVFYISKSSWRIGILVSEYLFVGIGSRLLFSCDANQLVVVRFRMCMPTGSRYGRRINHILECIRVNVVVEYVSLRQGIPSISVFIYTHIPQIHACVFLITFDVIRSGTV